MPGPRLEPGVATLGQRIVVLGGEGAVSPQVHSALAAYTAGPVERLDGKDRYETSARVSAATFRPGAPVAFLASGAYPWQRLITHYVRLEDVAGLLADPPVDYLKAAVVP